jgi:hypothetical protein
LRHLLDTKLVLLFDLKLELQLVEHSSDLCSSQWRVVT